MTYDVVVAGASFAGLTLATAVHGRVALVEKDQVGDGQTSACATTLDVMRKLHVEDAIEEVHTEAVMHTRNAEVRFRLPYDFCTFDYRRFCELLLDRFDGDLIAASAVKVEGDEVVTDRGSVSGRAIVDATGWRAALARSVDPRYPSRARVTYGLEKPAVGFEDSGLHFYFQSKLRADGYGWAFPAGQRTRAGVLSYRAAGGVKRSTEDFLAREAMHGGGYHGGYLSAGLRPALAGEVFVVGDAAGHCLPLTGEGIRPAVFFAQHLAGLLNAGDSLMDARAQYATLQRQYRKRYAILRAAQTMLRGWPDPPVGTFFQAFARGFLYRRISQVYWELAAPIEAAPWSASPSAVSA